MSKKFEFPEELNFIPVGRMPQKVSTTSMEGKVCVISGTTSGVGYQAAIRLAKAGAKIVMMVRDKAKAEKVSDEIKTISGTPADYYLVIFKNPTGRTFLNITTKTLFFRIPFSVSKG